MMIASFYVCPILHLFHWCRFKDMCTTCIHFSVSRCTSTLSTKVAGFVCVCFENLVSFLVFPELSA